MRNAHLQSSIMGCWCQNEWIGWWPSNGWHPCLVATNRKMIHTIEGLNACLHIDKRWECRLDKSVELSGRKRNMHISINYSPLSQALIHTGATSTTLAIVRSHIPQSYRTIRTTRRHNITVRTSTQGCYDTWSIQCQDAIHAFDIIHF